MPKIRYVDIKISADRLATIQQANRIIAEYAAQGFDLTLRQLYYQFVARGLIANRQSEYKRLGDVINDGRLAGLVDWSAIVDRTRNLESLSHWDSPADIVEACANQFNHDRWKTQPYRVEVWIEKDALVGVIEGVCKDLDVPYFSCRGYTSQSEMWAAAQRLKQYLKAGQTPVLLHFGDHDPSGIDMTRDIESRLDLFMGGVEVRRLALNWDQVERYSPPPNPTKLTDSRAKVYLQRYGHESWELDALDPAVLASLIRREIEAVQDPELWDVATQQQQEARGELQRISERYDDVRDFVKEEEEE